MTFKKCHCSGKQKRNLLFSYKEESENNRLMAKKAEFESYYQPSTRIVAHNHHSFITVQPTNDTAVV